MVGRNEPCPCGSGKKYKKCCLTKDEEQARVARAVIRPRPREREDDSQTEPDNTRPREGAAPVPLHLHREDDRCDELYGEFERATYDEKFAVFAKALREPKGMDAETAFEVMQELFAETATRDERDRFDAAVMDLRRERPDIYQSEVRYLIDMEIDNAIAGGRRGDLEARLRELATMTEEHMDLVRTTMDQLAFHGEQELLVMLAKEAWRTVAPNSETAFTADLSERAAIVAILDHVEKTGAAAGGDDALAAHLSVLGPGVPVDVAGYIARLRGVDPGRQALDDYRRADRGEKIGDLAIEFVGQLRRDEDVPYCKGELAARMLTACLSHREDAHRRRSRRGTSDRKPMPRGEKRPLRPDARHPLLPDRETLDQFVGGFFQMTYEPYPPIALLELLPGWLRFLESRGLLERLDRERTLDGLKAVARHVRSMVERETCDPGLVRALERSMS